MSTITREFTKEQLQQIEAAAKEVLWPVVWSEKKAREHFSEKITPEVVLKLARIALASLEAEPVGFIARHKETGKFGSYLHPKADWFKNDEYEVLSAYTAPPAPVVPDELLSELLAIAKKAADIADECAHAEFSDDSMEHSTAIADWERRAAMQGKSNRDGLPGWVACSERMPAHSKTILVITAFGEYWTGYFDRTDVFWCDETNVENVTHWMALPAAPQQESE